MRHFSRSSTTFKAAVRGPFALGVALLALGLSLAMPGLAKAAGPPTVSSIEPERGRASGGTLVTIKGTGFLAGATVTIGSSATVVEMTETEIKATTSATAAGQYEVIVKDSKGSSTLGPNFTYVAPPAVATTGASAVAATSATLKATVNPNGAEVTECRFEYGISSISEAAVPCSLPPGAGGAVSAQVTNLSANKSYKFRVSATNLGGTSAGMEKSFTTLPEGPTVVTEPATSVGETSATLNATVEPKGVEVSDCKFEYGTAPPYTESVPCAKPWPTEDSQPAVSAPVTGLTPGTTYQFRISASNAGTTDEGAYVTFTTVALPPAPVVETGTVAAITQTTATLNGTVNPEGSAVTECEFEYGTTTSYGQTAPCVPSPSSGTSPVSVSATITGLAVNMGYHVRIKASNAGGRGPSTGADEQFATLALISLPSGVPTFNPQEIGKQASELPPPILGRYANIAPVTGRVLVRVPGARGFEALTRAMHVQFGTVVEADHGEVSVKAATPGGGRWAGRFFDGRFVLTQSANGSVLATLSGGNFSVCSAAPSAGGAKLGRAPAKQAAGGHLVRRLWAETGGDFSTRGRYAEGIVQGAQWLTEDLCEGTLVLATRDRVQVADLVRGRQREVVEGHIDIVRPR